MNEEKVENVAVEPAKKEGKRNLVPIIVIAVIIIAVIVVIALRLNVTKTVTCTMSDDQGIGVMDTNVKADFKGNKFEHLDMEISYKLSDTYASQADLFYSEMEKAFASYKDKKGVTVDIKKNGNGVLVKIGADTKGVKEVNDVDGIAFVENLDQFVEGMEKDNYKCEVK